MSRKTTATTAGVRKLGALVLSVGLGAGVLGVAQSAFAADADTTAATPTADAPAADAGTTAADDSAAPADDASTAPTADPSAPADDSGTPTEAPSAPADDSGTPTEAPSTPADDASTAPTADPSAPAAETPAAATMADQYSVAFTSYVSDTDAASLTAKGYVSSDAPAEVWAATTVSWLSAPMTAEEAKSLSYVWHNGNCQSTTSSSVLALVTYPDGSSEVVANDDWLRYLSHSDENTSEAEWEANLAKEGQTCTAADFADDSESASAAGSSTSAAASSANQLAHTGAATGILALVATVSAGAGALLKRRRHA